MCYILLLTLALMGCGRPASNNPWCVRQAHALEDQARLEANNSIPDHPMTLQEVVDIVLCNNLEEAARAFERAVVDDQVAAQYLRIIPSLEVSFEGRRRSKPEDEFSLGIDTQLVTGPKLESAKNNNEFRVTGTLNVLDFSINYFQACQSKDHGYQVCLQHERARQNLILKTFKAYFRVLTAQQTKRNAEEILKSLQEREKSLQKQLTGQIVPQIRGVLKQTEILQWQARIAAFQGAYVSAQTELAALMGAPPTTTFALADITFGKISPSISLETLEEEALLYRPELSEQEWQTRIARADARSALLKLFPSLEITGGGHNLRDPFYLNHQWYNIALRTSTDLLQLPSNAYTYITKRRQVKLVERQKQLVAAMGVLTQVNLAYLQFLEQNKQYKLEEALYNSRKEAFETIELLYAAGKVGIDDVINYKTEKLFAEVVYFNAYGSLQVAIEQLGNATGQPLMFTLAN